MKLFKGIRRSLNKKLMLIFAALFTVSLLSIGMISYSITKEALEDKGKVILVNAVTMAKKLITSEYEKSSAGLITEEEAMENVKTSLIGPKNSDGTRFTINNIDLGENGYFIIYDLEGTEVLHPTLEGSNVYEVVDMNDSTHFIVQEQINNAVSGGGYTYYHWYLPHSEKIAPKISYEDFAQEWEWVVVATSYNKDFNSEADRILFVLIIVFVLTMILTSLFASTIVFKVTYPLINIVKAMKKVSEGELKVISYAKTEDEIGLITTGYNNMVMAIKDVNDTLMTKTNLLEYLAYNDDLTKLPNRIGISNAVNKSIEIIKYKGYLVHIDIKEFQLVNSVYGFKYGNQILKYVGDYLLSISKANLIVARTSGSEFSIWFEDVELETTINWMRRIPLDINNYLVLNDVHHQLDFYISMSNYPEDGLGFEALDKKASIAMKIGKSINTGSIHIFKQHMEENLLNEFSMQTYVKMAIENHEIVPYYQEKYDYKSKKVVGVEALARWNSKKLNVVGPSEFIPVIEQLNLISVFGEYMLDKVLSDYERLVQIYDHSISVSINISPSHFLDMTLVNTIKKMIHKYNVPASKIILEVTEQIFIADFTKISEIIAGIKDFGVRLSIDDFGTGYSSLNYLKKVQFDELKIDRSFITQMMNDEKVFELIKIICSIGKVYGYELVAEGVETQEQLDKISSTSLRVIQGYLFSKPQKLDQLKNSKQL